MIKTDFNIFDTKLVAGAAWSITESLADYPADQYDLKLKFIAKTTGATVKSITASASGTDFIISATAITTASYTKGWYKAQILIYETGTDVLVDMLTDEIYIDKLLTDSEETRSDDEIILDSIIATLKNSATREQGAISTPSGTNITYRSLQELNDLKDTYTAKVNRARKLQNGTFTRHAEVYL